MTNYTVNVYASIVNFFTRLEHLIIVETFSMSYPRLALTDLPSTVFSSSTLTHLCIDVGGLDDCLYLLDGRLKQLNTLTIRIDCIVSSSLTNHNMVHFTNDFAQEVRFHREEIFHSIEIRSPQEDNIVDNVCGSIF